MKADVTRRAFLGGSLALAGPRITAAAERMEDLKLGVASYSLRKFSLSQAISMIQQLKTPYVCWKEMHIPYNSTAAQIAADRKQIEDAGLKTLGGGVIYLEKPAEVRKMFDYCKAAGMPVMVCGPTPDVLPELEKMVKEFNIKAAIHNHGPEDKRFPTPQSVLKAIRGMDPRLGLCIDIGHTARAGMDIVESIREAGPRLLDMHIKDLKDTSREAEGVPVGEGVLPIVAIFKALKKMNYQGGIMLEYEVEANDPLPGMQKSFAYMRGVLAGLRG